METITTNIDWVEYKFYFDTNHTFFWVLQDWIIRNDMTQEILKKVHSLDIFKNVIWKLTVLDDKVIEIIKEYENYN